MAVHGLAYGFARPVLMVGALLALVSACATDSEEPQGSFDAATTVPDASVGFPGGGAGALGGATGGTGSNPLDSGAAMGTASGTAAMGGGIGAAGGGTGAIGGLGGLRDAGITFPSRDAGSRDAGAAAVDAGPPVPVGDGGPDQFAEVRQVCVDAINMHRATLSLPPLARASAAQESCSDEGAKYDGDLNRGKPANQVVGHQSTRNRSATCAKVGFGAQDACPNWGVGPRTGNATLADAIKRCLAQMWAEGMPPIPVADCIKDQAPGGCFLTHGHWINMASTSSKVVACGFYNVEGTTYWMNQDFAAR